MIQIVDQTPSRILALASGEDQATPWLSVSDGQNRFSLSVRPVEPFQDTETLRLQTAYEQGARLVLWLERKRVSETEAEARRVLSFDFDDDLQGAEQLGEVDSFWQLRLKVPTGGYGAGIWALELSL